MEFAKLCLFLSFRGVSSNDFSSLETLCKKIIKEKQTFERLEVKKETLLEMFKVNSVITTLILLASLSSTVSKFPVDKLTYLQNMKYQCALESVLTRTVAASIEMNMRGHWDVFFLISSITSSSAGY